MELLTFIMGASFGILLTFVRMSYTNMKLKKDKTIMSIKNIIPYDEYCEIESLVKKRYYTLTHTPYHELSTSDIDEIQTLESIMNNL